MWKYLSDNNLRSKLCPKLISRVGLIKRAALSNRPIAYPIFDFKNPKVLQNCLPRPRSKSQTQNREWGHWMVHYWSRSPSELHLITVLFKYLCWIQMLLMGLTAKVLVGGRINTNLRYMPTTLHWSLDHQMIYWNSSEEWSLQVNNLDSTMICEDERRQSIVVDGKEVDQEDTFNFLGSMIVKEGGSSVDTGGRQGMTKSSASTLSNIWKDRNITRATKIRVMKALLFPVAFYGCETWAVGKAAQWAQINFSTLIQRWTSTFLNHHERWYLGKKSLIL